MAQWLHEQGHRLPSARRSAVERNVSARRVEFSLSTWVRENSMHELLRSKRWVGWRSGERCGFLRHWDFSLYPTIIRSANSALTFAFVLGRFAHRF